MYATKNAMVATDRSYVIEPVTCKVDGEEQTGYTTHGFSVKDESGKMILRYGDVSTDPVVVERFIRLCLEHEVSLIHIPDVLEDFLE